MVNRARHYHPAAYQFVRLSLDYVLTDLEERRHISGQQLLQGIARYAKLRFGPFVRPVFEEWGVRETMDFGHIVFELVDRQIMTRQAEDSIDDFRDVYDFRAEFDEGYDYLSEMRRENLSSPTEPRPTGPEQEANS